MTTQTIIICFVVWVATAMILGPIAGRWISGKRK